MLFLTPKKQSRVWDKFPDGSTLIFGDTQITLQHSVVEVKGSRHTEKTAPLVQSFQYNTSLWRTERHTHNDSIYRASIAPHGKKCLAVMTVISRTADARCLRDGAIARMLIWTPDSQRRYRCVAGTRLPKCR